MNKLESANFIDDAFAGCSSQLIAEMVGDNQGARRGIEVRLGFKDPNAAASSCDFRRGV